MNPTGLVTLQKALARIERPGGWCQGVLGPETTDGPNCALGALIAVAGFLTDEYMAAWTALDTLVRPQPVHAFNNTHTQQEVVVLFRRAIASMSPADPMPAALRATLDRLTRGETVTP